MIFRNRKTRDTLKRRCCFISGCPRSGTSLLTKIIDSHPDIGILMEAIFNNRQRHFLRDTYWNSDVFLQREIEKSYSNIPELIVGNKVCNPDVWALDDIIKFCSFFDEYDIVWIVRNPVTNLRSRYFREPKDHYNEAARANLSLDFSNDFATWSSSWRQSIENYWRIKEKSPNNVHLVYYDDLISDFANEVRILFSKLKISFDDQILNWNKIPHYDAKGHKKFNVKYKDQSATKLNSHVLDPRVETQIEESLLSCEYWKDRWESRTL